MLPRRFGEGVSNLEHPLVGGFLDHGAILAFEIFSRPRARASRCQGGVSHPLETVSM